MSSNVNSSNFQSILNEGKVPKETGGVLADELTTSQDV